MSKHKNNISKILLDYCETCVSITLLWHIYFFHYLGHLKFWKKKGVGIEFAKHFRSHLGPIEGLAVSIGSDFLMGTLFCLTVRDTVTSNGTLKSVHLLHFFERLALFLSWRELLLGGIIVSQTSYQPFLVFYNFCFLQFLFLVLLSTMTRFNNAG